MALPATQGKYGAQGPLAPGSNAGYGAQTPSAQPDAGAPSTPGASPFGADRLERTRARLRARRPPVQGPPAGYRPSVNRDGTIPDQAPVAASGQVAPSPGLRKGPPDLIGPPEEWPGQVAGVNPPRREPPVFAGPEPPTGGISPRPVNQPLDPQEALRSFQAIAQRGSHLQRQATPQELQALLGLPEVGYSPGAPVDSDMLQRALYMWDHYTGDLSNPWVGGQKPYLGYPQGAAPEEPQMVRDQKGAVSAPGPRAPGPLSAAGGGGIDPNQALSQAAAAFQQKFGRAMTPQEQQMLIQAVGYSGGNVTEAQLQQALGLISQYTGNPANPLPPGGGGAASGGGLQNWEQLVQQQVTQAPPQLPTTELPAYTPSTGPQFVDPLDPQASAGLTSLINQILGSPESLNPQVVSQMKEAQKEQILSSNKQLQGELAQSAASRGAYGGGNMEARQRRAADATTGELARSGRDIDIAAAQTNMGDRRAAAQLADQFLTSQLGRGLGAHGARMDTARFNAGEQQLAHQARSEQVSFALQRALAQAGLSSDQIAQLLQGWQISTQGKLGERGLNLDKERIDLNRQQFEKAHQLDWLRALNDMVMGRANYGLNLAQLQQTGQNSMFDWIFGGRG